MFIQGSFSPSYLPATQQTQGNVFSNLFGNYSSPQTNWMIPYYPQQPQQNFWQTPWQWMQWPTQWMWPVNPMQRTYSSPYEALNNLFAAGYRSAEFANDVYRSPTGQYVRLQFFGWSMYGQQIWRVVPYGGIVPTPTNNFEALKARVINKSRSEANDILAQASYSYAGIYENASAWDGPITYIYKNTTTGKTLHLSVSPMTDRVTDLRQAATSSGTSFEALKAELLGKDVNPVNPNAGPVAEILRRYGYGNGRVLPRNPMLPDSPNVYEYTDGSGNKVQITFGGFRIGSRPYEITSVTQNRINDLAALEAARRYLNSSVFVGKPYQGAVNSIRGLGFTKVYAAPDNTNLPMNYDPNRVIVIYDHNTGLVKSVSLTEGLDPAARIPTTAVTDQENIRSQLMNTPAGNQLGTEPGTAAYVLKGLGYHFDHEQPIPAGSADFPTTWVFKNAARQTISISFGGFTGSTIVNGVNFGNNIA